MLIITAALLAQAIKALNGADVNLFLWRHQFDTRSFDKFLYLFSSGMNNILSREHKIHIFELTCNVLFIM